MEGLVASAALSYRQALRPHEPHLDCRTAGPANELREALREVVDELAPDEGVVGQKGFVSRL
jgi:hypothetical protein